MPLQYGLAGATNEPSPQTATSDAALMRLHLVSHASTREPCTNRHNHTSEHRVTQPSLQTFAVGSSARKTAMNPRPSRKRMPRISQLDGMVAAIKQSSASSHLTLQVCKPNPSSTQDALANADPAQAIRSQTHPIRSPPHSKHLLAPSRGPRTNTTCAKHAGHTNRAGVPRNTSTPV